MKPDGHHAIETSLSGLAPGLAFTFKGDDSDQGDIGVEYSQGLLSAAASCDVISASSLSGSFSLNKDALTLGSAATYSLKANDLDKFSLGASYNSGALFAAVTTTKLSKATLNVKYTVNKDLTLATSSTHSATSPLSTVTLGAVYAAGDLGTLKAKVTSDGAVEAAVVKDIAKKVTVNPSVRVSAHRPSETWAYGLGITVG